MTYGNVALWHVASFRFADEIASLSGQSDMTGLVGLPASVANDPERTSTSLKNDRCRV
jgi:hypothetical protein